VEQSSSNVCTIVRSNTAAAVKKELFPTTEILFAIEGATRVAESVSQSQIPRNTGDGVGQKSDSDTGCPIESFFTSHY